MFHRFAHRPLALAVMAIALTASSVATAQSEPPENYPSRNILLVVPFAAGGPPDVIARVLAPSMGEALGR